MKYLVLLVLFASSAYLNAAEEGVVTLECKDGERTTYLIAYSSANSFADGRVLKYFSTGRLRSDKRYLYQVMESPSFIHFFPVTGTLIQPHRVFDKTAMTLTYSEIEKTLPCEKQVEKE